MQHGAHDFSSTDESEKSLIREAQDGSVKALEKLVLVHQAWMHNIALRMVGQAADAKDVVQEVLARVVAHLSAFRGESTFRTWIYRIMSNYVINMKKRPRERVFASLEEYGRALDALQDADLPDSSGAIDSRLLVEETKLTCMNGMLLCLDRKQRLVFVLGVLGANSAEGGRMLGITVENYRQVLGRARAHIASFMSGRCGQQPATCARRQTPPRIRSAASGARRRSLGPGWVQRLAGRIFAGTRWLSI